MKLKGLYTAIITPFNKEGRIDEDGLRENIEYQIKNRVDGVVPVGTTGESATLSVEEHRKVVETTVDQVNSRGLVIAGTGSNNTDEAIEYTKHAKDVGADVALMISPYYNKPTQEGIYQHYKKIAETVDIPIIIYTVPSRTMVNIEPETTKKLSEFPNIIGIKDASGNLNQISREIMLCGEDFIVLSGDDSINLPIISLGGDGAISVMSNIIPKETGELIREALDGNLKKAKEMHYRLYNLSKVLFIETSPSPLKAAMTMLGMPAGEPRLPLVPVKDESREEIRKILQSMGLL